MRSGHQRSQVRTGHQIQTVTRTVSIHVLMLVGVHTCTLLMT